MEKDTRPNWSSELVFIMSAIGSAVGLGNIWRFPYIMGENGGAIFLLVYLILIFGICIVPLIAEISVGHTSRKNCIITYSSINKNLAIFGWLNIIAVIMISAFYFVVCGWILNYMFLSVSNFDFTNLSNHFQALTTSKFLAPTLTVVFTFLTALISYRGLDKGVEVANKFMVPAFGIIMLVLMGFSLNLPHAIDGLKFMFYPDFSKFNMNMVLLALGQALFTLSIGMSAMFIYGSYLKKETKIIKNSVCIVLFDTLFALSAGIMIFCAVFSFGLEPTSGAGLVFITLPQIFSKIPYGNLVALLFFVLLFFTAITSAIAMFEVPVASFIENLNMTRKKASVVLFVIISILAIPTSLSLGAVKWLTFYGKSLFDMFDYMSSNILLPLNTLIICLIAGYAFKDIYFKIFKNKLFANLFIFMLRWLLPAVLIILMYEGSKI